MVFLNTLLQKKFPQTNPHTIPNVTIGWSGISIKWELVTYVEKRLVEKGWFGIWAITKKGLLLIFVRIVLREYQSWKTRPRNIVESVLGIVSYDEPRIQRMVYRGTL